MTKAEKEEIIVNIKWLRAVIRETYSPGSIQRGITLKETTQLTWDREEWEQLKGRDSYVMRIMSNS